MAERIRFYYHEKGNHDETWHFLCLGKDGEVHVETEFSAGPGRGDMEVGKPFIRSVNEFLGSGRGTAQDKLRALLDERGIEHA
ncbi:hypothetical protein V6R86_08405 [Sphingomonas kaistensis]|uniref:Uncharacterized protein n=1 Tax=Sphingomonas kaistensis TaxID=298708 RepID=A0ABZ2G0R4_9SPHN